MRKPAFLHKRKQRRRLAAELHVTADQHLCFCYTDSTIPLLPKYEISKLAICGCTTWFVFDVVGNPKDRFSHNEAHMVFGLDWYSGYGETCFTLARLCNIKRFS